MSQGTGVQVLSILIILSLAVCQGISAKIKGNYEKGIRVILAYILFFALLRCFFNITFIFSQVYHFTDLFLKWNFQLNITGTLLTLSAVVLVIWTVKKRNPNIMIDNTLKFIIFAMGFNVMVNLIFNSSIFYSDYYVKVLEGNYIFGSGKSVADKLHILMLVLMLLTIIVVHRNLVLHEKLVYYGFVFMSLMAAILNVMGVQSQEADGYTIAMVVSVMFIFIGEFLNHSNSIADMEKEIEETAEELHFMMSDSELLTQAFTKLVLFSYRLDLHLNYYREIKTTDWFRKLLGNDGSPHKALERWVTKGIDSDFYESMTEFIDLNTLPDRMRDRDVISTECLSAITNEWLKLYVVCVSRTADGKVCDTLWLAQSITEEKEREQKYVDALFKVNEAQSWAEHDALTGLYNRAGFDRICKSMSNGHEKIGLVLIDVDDFKGINDRHGHDVGDGVLRFIGDTLRTHFSSKDYVFRFGGDEFAVVLSSFNANRLEFIKERMQTINYILHNEVPSALPGVSLSSGVAFTEAGYTKELFKTADNNLYEIKRIGKGGCKWS